MAMIPGSDEKFPGAADLSERVGQLEKELESLKERVKKLERASGD